MTFWQGEELRFTRALLTFDPLEKQPEPPGYPLYVAIGRLLDFFVRQPYVTLVALSVIAAVAGAYLTALVAANLLGNEWAGAAAAIVLYFSPAMLLFDTLPNAEAVTVALVAAAMLAMARGSAIAFGIFAGCAIGARPQIAPAMLAAVILFSAGKPWRRAAEAGGATLIALVVCFVPLIEAIGASNLLPYAEVNYAAVRTASATATVHGRDLLLRFVADSWGTKWASYPLLIAAAIGFFWRIADRRWQIAAVFAAVHLVVCVAFADRTSGVQPVIPALIVIAIFAVAAISRWPAIAVAAATVYAVVSFAYAWPILHLRHTTASPAARAMRFARRALPRGSVLLYEPSLEAWARFSRFDVEPVRDFDRYADRPDTALFLLADGGSQNTHAAHFDWPNDEAFGKVTPRRGRVVSLIPFPPADRYRSLGGIYGFERTQDGRDWRWVEQDAVLELPRLGVRLVRVTLALPADAPIESNRVTVNRTTVVVTRGQIVTFAVPATRLLRIHSARSFTSERDRRSLSVQLVSLEQR